MAKHREFQSEVTVYVWRYTSIAHFGHAAVKLTGLPGVNGGEQKAYISWWPGRNANLGTAFLNQKAARHHTYKNDMWNELSPRAEEKLESGRFQPRGNQRRVVAYTDDDGDPVLKWGVNADDKIKIPAQGAGAPWGLDIVRMFKWWELFRRAPHPTYRLASKHTNCAGVAAAALRVGGGDQFAPPPKAVMFLDPNQIGAWARDIRARCDELNRRANIFQAMALDAGEVQLVEVAEVMGRTEWERLSNQKMGGAWMRSEKVKEMDQLLKKYHAKGGWTEEVSLSKLKLLGKLFDVVHYYLAHKPGSKRGDAVLTLGQQVLSVAKAKAEEYGGTAYIDEKTLWARQDLLAD